MQPGAIGEARGNEVRPLKMGSPPPPPKASEEAHVQYIHSAKFKKNTF